MNKEKYKLKNYKIGKVNKCIVVLIMLLSLIVPTNAFAREFIDYTNEVSFKVNNTYEIIRADGKFFGFQNEKFKLVYNVITNGQITDKLPFNNFNDVTDEKIISTVNNIGFNSLNLTVNVKENKDLLKYVEFEGKSGEVSTLKNIYYVNDKFYIFQIIALDKEKAKFDEYKEELANISISISTDSSKFLSPLNGEIYYYEEKVIEEDAKVDNIEGTKGENEDKESIIVQIEQMFEKDIKINKVGAILIIGTIFALFLLRKFAVIFEYSIIKYVVGIVFGYFAYRLYENFYYSMDLEMNKFATILTIIMALSLVIIPKSKKKKTKKERLRDEEDTKNAENAIKSIDKI